jgi:hypothetical protein
MLAEACVVDVVWDVIPPHRQSGAGMGARALGGGCAGDLRMRISGLRWGRGVRLLLKDICRTRLLGPGCTRVAGPRIYGPFVAWGRWGWAQDGDAPVHSSAWGFAPEGSAHRRCGAHGGRVRLGHEGNTYLPACSWSRFGGEAVGGKAKM